MQADFETFLPMGSKETKIDATRPAIFANFGNGVKTNRDTWAYNFSRDPLAANMRRMIDFYNEHVYRRQRTPGKINADSFVTYDEKQISWSESLKKRLIRGAYAEFNERAIRPALYRPFATQNVMFDSLFAERTYQFPHFFPTTASEAENRAICVSDIGHRAAFSAFMTGQIADLHLLAPVDAFQYFPFYTYNEDGSARRENITDWALARFREVYEEKGPGSRDQGPGKKGTREEHSSPGTWPLEPGTYPLDKWAIFHYVYALLHHPTYRETYAANLRRELPRIPFVRDFWGFARAGARLAELHVNYEAQPEYPLQRIETPGEPLDWRVEKMALSKDRTQIRYNDFLTLAGVPAATFDYRLGNRSALEWVIDQYRVTTDRRSGITNDPNRPDDPEYIVRLIGQVVAVSVATVEIVRALPPLEVIEEIGR